MSIPFRLNQISYTPRITVNSTFRLCRVYYCFSNEDRLSTNSNRKMSARARSKLLIDSVFRYETKIQRVKYSSGMVAFPSKWLPGVSGRQYLLFTRQSSAVMHFSRRKANASERTEYFLSYSTELFLYRNCEDEETNIHRVSYSNTSTQLSRKVSIRYGKKMFRIRLVSYRGGCLTMTARFMMKAFQSPSLNSSAELYVVLLYIDRYSF